MITLFFVSLVSNMILPSLSCTISWQSFTGCCDALTWLHLVLMRYFLLLCPSMVSPGANPRSIAGAQNRPAAVTEPSLINCLRFIFFIFPFTLRKEHCQNLKWLNKSHFNTLITLMVLLD